MAITTAAKPQGFVLKMRIVQPDGTPFFSRSFRVKWGEALFPPENKEPFQTDKDGAFSVLLPEPPPVAPQGEVRFVDRSDRNEIVRWVIPVQIADPAPLFPFPALLSGYVPPPSHVEPSAQAEQADRRTKYEQDVIRQIRENLGELQRFWGEMNQIVAVLPDAPLTSDPDARLIEAWEAAVLAYTAMVNGYEAAFRLWNMADLPLLLEPSIALLGADRDLLLRAIGRFAHRHALSSSPAPPTFATPELLQPVFQKIKDVHDKRDGLRPTNP